VYGREMKLGLDQASKFDVLAINGAGGSEKLVVHVTHSPVRFYQRKEVSLVRSVTGRFGRRPEGRIWLQRCRVAGRASFWSAVTSTNPGGFTHNKSLKPFVTLTRTRIKPAPLS